MKLVIDELIKERGLKQIYVAKQLGVNKDTVTNWCKNRSMPKLDKAVELAELLGVEITDLYIKK
jgi:putative transcriptional regulator